MFYNKADGKIGEETAEKYLKKRGYFFISRNYWTDSGEIDLIFYRSFTLIFVEVKTRSGSEYGTGREAVDFAKQRNIKNSSKDFIRAHCINKKVPFYFGKIPIYLPYKKVRYDVIEICHDSKYSVYSHLKSYFK